MKIAVRMWALLSAFLIFPIPVFSYDTDYPPFAFSDKPYKKYPLSGVSFKVEKKRLYAVYGKSSAYLMESDLPNEYYENIYRADLNQDGLGDFVLFSWLGGTGLAANITRVDIFLKNNDRGFKRISFDSLFGGIEDFVDLKGDGKCRIIVGDVYGGKDRNYFSYNLFKVSGYRLSECNHELKGFPKFIWYTNKPNDKNTIHLTQIEKQKSAVNLISQVRYFDPAANK